MEFYEVISKRRTIRDFKEDTVDIETIERILSAGLKAPTNDHMRNWEFIVVNDRDVIAQIVKKIPKKVSEKRLDFIMKSWKLNDECQQQMYRDGIPKQYQMLSQSGCLILPLFQQKPDALLKPKSISSLNAFASIWCCIENIFLAATAEGLGYTLRIPLGEEAERLAEIISYPSNYVIPCYISIGYPAEDASLPQQKEVDLKKKIHFNQW